MCSPKGWYPGNTPPNMEKWKIPACSPCNSRYGCIEDDLGIVIPLCLGPDAPNATGLYQKALRAIDPSHGRNHRDRVNRRKKRQKLFRSLLKGHEIPNAVYPGFEERWNRAKSDQVGLPVPVDHLKQLVVKIVKGITYIEDRIYLNEHTQIEHHVVKPSIAAPLEKAVRVHGEIHSQRTWNRSRPRRYTGRWRLCPIQDHNLGEASNVRDGEKRPSTGRSSGIITSFLPLRPFHEFTWTTTAALFGRQHLNF